MNLRQHEGTFEAILNIFLISMFALKNQILIILWACYKITQISERQRKVEQKTFTSFSSYIHDYFIASCRFYNFYDGSVCYRLLAFTNFSFACWSIYLFLYYHTRNLLAGCHKTFLMCIVKESKRIFRDIVEEIRVLEQQRVLKELLYS